MIDQVGRLSPRCEPGALTRRASWEAFLRINSHAPSATGARIRLELDGDPATVAGLESQAGDQPAVAFVDYQESSDETHRGFRVDTRRPRLAEDDDDDGR